MSGSHHHSKKGRVRNAETEAERLSAADEVAADLRRQVAILAEQVRALGSGEAAGGAASPPARWTESAASSSTSEDLPLPPAPRPRPPANAPPPKPEQVTRPEPEAARKAAPRLEAEPKTRAGGAAPAAPLPLRLPSPHHRQSRLQPPRRPSPSAAAT